MDKNKIIEWVTNAVLVIVTTAVVTRLSLNQGKLGVTSKLKARFTPKFRAYTKLIFSVLIFIVVTFNLYALTANSTLPTRFDVLLIILNFSGVSAWFVVALHSLRDLFDLIAQEKAKKERELWQPLLDQMKEARAVLDQSRELVGEIRNKPLDAPEDSIASKPSDSQNPKE